MLQTYGHKLLHLIHKRTMTAPHPVREQIPEWLSLRVLIYTEGIEQSICVIALFQCRQRRIYLPLLVKHMYAYVLQDYNDLPFESNVNKALVSERHTFYQTVHYFELDDL